ncbi:MAG: DEAD/DEAH box helicase [Phycisphaerales bacterium]
MIVLHANWSDGRLHFWAEAARSPDRLRGVDEPASGVALASTGPSSGSAAEATAATATLERPDERAQHHPYSADAGALRGELIALGLQPAMLTRDDAPLRLRLPADESGAPSASPRFARHAGLEQNGDHALALRVFSVDTVSAPAEHVLPALAALDNANGGAERWFGDSVRYWIVVGRVASELIAAQRVVPALTSHLGGDLQGGWRLWLDDEETLERLASLMRAMPPVARANASGPNDPWTILDDLLNRVTDATIRRYFDENNLIGAIRGWRRGPDLHTAWLEGLLDETNRVRVDGADDVRLIRGARQWVGRLSDRGQGQPFHLCFRLREPAESEQIPELSPPGDDIRWPLEFLLQSSEDATVQVEAERVWNSTGDVLFAEGRRLDQPQELLLAELSRASKMYPAIEEALAGSAPSRLELSTNDAYAFLRDIRPLLEESGFAIETPAWWSLPETRLAARLQVESSDIPEDDPLGFSVTPAGKPTLGLDSIVSYSWEIALGDQVLTFDEFKQLAEQGSPLVRIRGRWIEVRPEDIRNALEFLKRGDNGEITVREALRLAYGSEPEQSGLPVVGMDATGWVGRLFGATGTGETLRPVPQPQAFDGQLRPYQVKGLSWLVFLDRFGLGACLADDMGLGKTIQLIALLLFEREQAPEGYDLGPTLLVVPTSVVGNWVREIRRFAPELRVLVHHGLDRAKDDDFIELASSYDVVITTYALVYRDRETLSRMRWRRVCLDEAQNIKNPTAKQTAAIRDLKADRRVALTGTPVENRLSELWSILEFLNPGYLGSQTEFRRNYAVPIERYRDAERAARLRSLVQPFVLRRLKTDPHVIADLPEKLEYKVYCSLTAEQARLYEETVKTMLEQVDDMEGMQRRGAVLAALTRLKQICNHPAHFAYASASDEDRKQIAAKQAVGGLSHRGGKTARIIEMLEEVLAEGDSALIFTQFREMGRLLSSMIRHELDIDTLFLHGGTPAAKRQEMIDRFQKRDGTAPVFILSLKAGGLGLNLTAANHVFHFDRWWNPAVENQATDRAFRIGQTRAVQVHKFVCSGTLEERIDQMIEEKIELAENVIGSGEQWLTELSTQQLRDLLTLRHDDVAEETAELEDDPEAWSGLGG